jgi:REP element-mobilizing transposase RayT
MYFVTICTRDRICLFGSIVEEAMRVNALGGVVEDCWRSLPAHHSQVCLDEFVVMPNHIHGIVVLEMNKESGAMNRAPTKLGEIVRAFKARSARQSANIIRCERSRALWQRNYHEHVIRDEDGLDRIRDYISCNPAKWAMDWNNPAFRSNIANPASKRGLGEL